MIIGQLIKILQAYQKKYGNDTEVDVTIKSRVSNTYDEYRDILDFRIDEVSNAYKQWKKISLEVQYYEDNSSTWKI